MACKFSKTALRSPEVKFVPNWLVNAKPAKPLVRTAAFKLDEVARAGEPTDALAGVVGVVAGVAGVGAKAPEVVAPRELPVACPERF